MPVVVVAANEISFQMNGEGDQCMLFIHGIGDDLNIWKQLVDHFSSTFKCFLFSWKGFGESKMNISSGFTPEILAKELKGIIEELNIKSDIYVIANNAGALAAIKADMDDLVRSKAIIAINTADRFKLKKLKYKDLYKSLMDNNKMKMVEKMNLKDAFEKKQAAIEQWLRDTSSVDFASKSPYVETPIDFVMGSKNNYVSMKDVEASVDRIPSSRIVQLDAGNWPMLESPDALIEEIEDFIGKYIPSLDKKT
ncbi:MAG TPA: alpha/beta hydrolase [Candidatus Lokiarchaeia archaeon]|nr:alpha/beta hydrolase [Candidatus Lokiarchaeia archaeon]